MDTLRLLRSIATRASATLAVPLVIGSAGLAACHEPEAPDASPLGAAIGAPPTGFYEALDLGTLDGGSSVAVAVDDSGRVVGTSGGHAFIWQNGTMTGLSGAAGMRAGAQSIGRNGDIGGYSADSMTAYLVTWDAMGAAHRLPMARPGAVLDVRGFMAGGWVANVAYNDADIRTLLYLPGQEIDLGSFAIPGLGFRSTMAHAMNAQGQIVGASAHHLAGPGWPINHAFIWENGAIRDLGTMGPAPCPGYPTQDCGSAEAWSINDQGDVVGTGFAAGVGMAHWRPLLWHGGSPTDLGVAPGQDAWATFINNTGQIAGVVASNGPFRGWRWQDGVATEFATLGIEGQVTGMNSRGDVIGMSQAGADYHAFVWTGGRMIDLGVGSVGPRSMAIAINDRGDVVGWTGSADGSGTRHAMLWRLH
jgi:probable HAF family extracellular repeat protein